MIVAACAAETGALSRNISLIIRAPSSFISGAIGFPDEPWAANVFAMMSVPMWPGITTATFTCGALTRKFSMSASVKPLTANFAAQYAVCGTPGRSAAQKPLTLLVLTRYPSVPAISSGTNARAPL